MTKIDFDEPSTGDVNSGNTALVIKNTGLGGGISCQSTGSAALRAESENSIAVVGISNKQIEFGVPHSESPSNAVVAGFSNSQGVGFGVAGTIKGERGVGVWGIAEKNGSKGIGMKGESKSWIGVMGESKSWIGVMGSSGGYVGVQGEARSNNNASGVFGICNGDHSVNGVKGKSTGGIGVLGESDTHVAILGRAPIAGRFEGALEVTGDIQLVNADCAEDFNISESELESIEAGTVMVLTENGSLQSSYQEYDKKAAGIVSGANGYKPAMVLDRQQQSQYHNQNDKNKKDRLPIALMGKVYCKVDATCSSIGIGDLLTTSSRRGYAMKAEDPTKAFGAVIGKALGSLKDGLGMIPVLVTLQ